jgi:hypothetical protein
MHRLEVQLALDGAMADLQAERIKSLPPARSYPETIGFQIPPSSLDANNLPADQQFEPYFIIGFDPDLDEAIIQFSADLQTIIAEHGHDNLRWRRVPKLTHSVDDGCQPHWKITARLIAALTPEAASQLP